MSTPVKTKKKSIPKAVKDLSWNKWVGDDIGKTKCMCCGVNEIKMNSFHCGHVIAEAAGGKATVDNLRPICSACNLSMGTENLEDFKRRCGFTDTPAAAAGASVTPLHNLPPAVQAKFQIGLSGSTTTLAKKLAPKEPSAREKRVQQLLSLGYIKLVPGDMINRDKCKHCSNYFHNPFKNVMCPCQMCDSCNVLQKRELYTPGLGIVCHH